MRGIAVYLEGGGQSRGTKQRLRVGMGHFLGQLKERARTKSMFWKIVVCGGRDGAFQQWIKQPLNPRYPIRILLVDAEGPVSGGVRAHLERRDSWMIPKAEEENVHLMVQTMETWIAADRSALADYYGHRFLASALPVAEDLEAIPKDSIQTALTRATLPTQKRAYHKTRHAPDLLRRIDPVLVRKRCRMCDRLFKVVDGLIPAA